MEAEINKNYLFIGSQNQGLELQWLSMLTMGIMLILSIFPLIARSAADDHAPDGDFF